MCDVLDSFRWYKTCCICLDNVEHTALVWTMQNILDLFGQCRTCCTCLDNVEHTGPVWTRQNILDLFGQCRTYWTCLDNVEHTGPVCGTYWTYLDNVKLAGLVWTMWGLFGQCYWTCLNNVKLARLIWTMWDLFGQCRTCCTSMNRLDVLEYAEYYVLELNIFKVETISLRGNNFGTWQYQPSEPISLIPQCQQGDIFVLQQYNNIYLAFVNME